MAVTPVRALNYKYKYFMKRPPIFAVIIVMFTYVLLRQKSTIYLTIHSFNFKSVSRFIYLFLLFRYGQVQTVKLLPNNGDCAGMSATVAFMDIKSACKVNTQAHKLDER